MRETRGQVRDCLGGGVGAEWLLAKGWEDRSSEFPVELDMWIWSASLTSEHHQGDWVTEPRSLLPISLPSPKRPLCMLAPELWSKGYLLWQPRQSRLSSFRGAWSLLWIKEVLAYVWVQSGWVASGKKQSLVQSLAWLIFLALPPEHQLSCWCRKGPGQRSAVV